MRPTANAPEAPQGWCDTETPYHVLMAEGEDGKWSLFADFEGRKIAGFMSDDREQVEAYARRKGWKIDHVRKYPRRRKKEA